MISLYFWTTKTELIDNVICFFYRSLSTDYDIDHTDAPVSPTDPDTGEHSSSGEKIKEDQKQSSSTPPLKPMVWF